MASNSHTEFSAMAQSKCIQIDEQLSVMKAREELQVEKIELELAVIREREKREKEAHAVAMQVKNAQLKLLIKQLDVQEE